MEMFTSLLQSGILTPTAPGNSIGVFLENIQGFTTDYITSQVQTIFLDGTATDDMETKFAGENPVLALSAAMPGLAGAIFRKNSLHAALRTTKIARHDACGNSRITVTLKLFNTIARDRGPELLRQGVSLKAAGLKSFLDARTTLPSMIMVAELEGKTIPRHDLPKTLTSLDRVHLTLID
jgi:hypothetical protein